MRAPDAKLTDISGKRSGLQTSWPEPLSLKEWDEQYPGVFDALSIAGAGEQGIWTNLSLHDSRIPAGQDPHGNALALGRAAAAGI